MFSTYYKCNNLVLKALQKCKNAFHGIFRCWWVGWVFDNVLVYDNVYKPLISLQIMRNPIKIYLSLIHNIFVCFMCTMPHIIISWADNWISCLIVLLSYLGFELSPVTLYLSSHQRSKVRFYLLIILSPFKDLCLEVVQQIFWCYTKREDQSGT